jgi:hypothetical protein
VGDADDTRPIGILATSDLIRAMSFYPDPAPAGDAPEADPAPEGPRSQARTDRPAAADPGIRR